MSKIKRASVYIISVLLAILVFISVVISYAYFSRKEIYDGYLSGQIELLFDRLNSTGLQSYGTAESITADGGAEWGTKENPYVISDVKHLYNLSELQRLGYFYKKHLQYNTEDDLSNIPYFLVCTPNYTPVVIDGSSFDGITAIGTNDYPFIGSVKGVSGDQVEIGDTGNTCATSVIHNVNVSGNPANTDIGLFGYVGFLGTPPEEGTTETTFTGMPSTISNLVLSDVTINVKSSLWDKVISFVDDIALGSENGGHRYSFTDLYGTDNYATVAHENHHIGILAGHVSYSTVEYISVFYSSDDNVAIDLHDVTELEGGDVANYMSCSGILGFIYNMNPDYNAETGEITSGSGSSIGDLSYNMVGGGGEIIGSKSGYVIARKIYDTYHYISAGTDGSGNAILEEDTTGTVILKDAMDSEGHPLCKEWVKNQANSGAQSTGKYYFYDGVFTFALSSDETTLDQDVIEPTWANGTADSFSIGSTNREDWIANNPEGVYAVSAYISKITSDKELQDAITNNVPLVIMREDDAASYLMSLYEKSATNDSNEFNQKYTTNGKGAVYTDSETVNAIVQNYEDLLASGNLDKFTQNFEVYGDGVVLNDQVAAIIEALRTNNSNWKVINVGTSSGSLSIDELRSQYKITGTTLKDKYAYYDLSGTPLAGTEDNTEIEDFYDYSNSGYDGYFYYTETKKTILFISYTVYTYYWQPIASVNGSSTEPILLDEEITTNPTNYFGNSVDTWVHETNTLEYTYSHTVTIDDTDTACTGVVVNKTTAKFLSGNTANADGVYLTKPSEEKVYFFYRPVGDTYFYYSQDTGDNKTKYTLNANDPQAVTLQPLDGEFTIAGDQLYTADNKTGILVDRYQTYSFSAKNKDGGTNTLRMLQATFNLRGTNYTLWNGTDADRENYNNFTLTYLMGLGTDTAHTVLDSIQATVKFNTDGTCYIQYSIGSVTQYVSFNGNTSSPGFNTAINTSGNNTKICIYALRGTQSLETGRVIFEPDEGDGISFSADKHVLYATKDAGGNTVYEVLEIEKLPNLGSEILGWNNGDAQDNRGILHSGNLQKKFRMMYGIDFALSIDAIGYSGEGLITAPVGTDEIEANIPMGCVAFRVNKEGEEKHIRVIISVAVSEFFVGEEDATGSLNTLGDFNRYFNLWQLNETGSNFIDFFNKDDYYDRFQIPISHPYDPKTTSSSDSAAQGFYNNITYDGNTYGMYMNGGRVLVAYEFTVTDVGLYMLGSSGDADGSDVPMEIVYFSADGTAGSGRDGASGSQLGSIDFVYENDGVIVTATDSSSTDSEGNEVYSTFYPSYVLLHFKNATTTNGQTVFNDVNYERIRVRRYITDEDPPTSSEGFNTTTSRSTIGLWCYGDGYTAITQYSRSADNIKKESIEKSAENTP